jgi:hypothetical protein
MAERVLQQETAEDQKRRLWLERVGKELAVAEAWEVNRSPDQVVTHLDTMVDSCDQAAALQPQDKLDVRERARAIKLKIYEGHINFLLEQAMAVTRDKDRQTERGEVLRQVNEALNVAARLGIREAIKQGIKDRLDIIKQTSAAGDSTEAKVAADREAALVERVHPREHRTFTRWRTPPLLIAIGGQAYGTIDWSLGGALLQEVEERGWKCGQTIDVKISLPDGKPHLDKMLVVRYSPNDKRLAIRTRRFASVFMQVKRECDAAGNEPL